MPLIALSDPSLSLDFAGAVGEQSTAVPVVEPVLPMSPPTFPVTELSGLLTGIAAGCPEAGHDTPQQRRHTPK
ncbi:MAG: hypothetical protein U5L03_17700 [Burkholderiaceae bacterium]|nr:hypothetical protein [Burkholderiaceae bacterium]